MHTPTFSVREIKVQLTSVIEWVNENDREVIITYKNIPTARILPIGEFKKKSGWKKRISKGIDDA